MPATTKQRTKASPDLARFKQLWSASFSEADRDYWRSQLSSSRGYSALRAELQTKLGIVLKWDCQLVRFQKWLVEQDALDAHAERMQENENRLLAQHAHWPLARVREEVLRRAYFESIARGNWRLGLETVRQELAAKKTRLETRRVELLEQKAAALEAVKGVMESALTPEEQRERLREILK